MQASKGAQTISKKTIKDEENLENEKKDNQSKTKWK
jgi:hypothetical protein